MSDDKNVKEEKKSKDVFDIIWDWLCSLKVNVIVLILLALTSIFGTVIPQNDPEKMEPFVIRALMLVKVVSPVICKDHGEKEAPSLQELPPSMQSTVNGIIGVLTSKFTDLGDMYHSYWFVALLGLLCVTITCCSIDKFPVVWRFISKPKTDLDDQQAKLLSLKETLQVNMSLKDAAEKYKSFLKQNISSPIQTEINGVYHLFSQKGLFSRLGVYVTHLSLLIIIIGALVGLFFGYKGYVQIQEFTKTSEVYLNSGKKKGTMYDVGFTLRLDGYETTYYKDANNEDTSQPKDFTSTITVVDGGKDISKNTVRVNTPLRYKGFTFYQSNYSIVDPAGFTCYMLLDIYKKGELIFSNGVLYDSRKYPIPGTSDKLEFVITPQFKDWARKTFKEYHYLAPINQAMLNLYKDGGNTPENILLTAPYPQEKTVGDYKFIIKRAKALEYTGLQVANDPGVLTVYTGCIMMIIGTLIAFFLSHKRFWVRIEEDKAKDKVKVTFAANTNKNKEAFEREFDALKEKFKTF